MSPDRHFSWPKGSSPPRSSRNAVAADCSLGRTPLRRPRGATFLRRLARDLSEQRKAPRVLVRRGVALLRAEPAILRRQTGLGAEAARAREVLRRVAGLLAGHPHG
ncbi:hypothetical protein [Micromonospora zamorensis]|uniref:hypothetical protein n=1 Tax=Micromonospora zamorensis TaxID=709883 RepID=UPI00081FC327|nr:hypothetical protein [Micromonospora zamorensis]SCG34268.1 hypothetical protein GA0070619_0004 [Micromonospora zamorensis]